MYLHHTRLANLPRRPRGVRIWFLLHAAVAVTSEMELRTVPTDSVSESMTVPQLSLGTLWSLRDVIML